MSSSCGSQQRSVLGKMFLGMASIALGLGLPFGEAQAASGVTRVEEDWELVVIVPDTNNNGPQVTCTISPLTVQAAYAAFDINYQTQPEYVAGGLQMHVWNPYTPIVKKDFPVSGMLSHENETITWTQSMSLNEGVLKFKVANGQSTTWGSFGGDLHAITVYTRLDNLSGYDPEVSLQNSGVSFASTLVGSLTLKAVRWYDVAGNLVQEVTTPQQAYPRN